MSRVALIGDNSVEYVDTLIDIWNHGDCVVLIDWRIPFQTATSMMIEASVSKCYIERIFYNKFDIASYPYIEFIPFERKDNSACCLPKSIYEKFQTNYTRNEAIVIYSSGTTGKAKGVILSHFAINTNADAIIEYMSPADDCIYIAKSFTHASTLTGELLVALKTRMKLVVAPTIVPPRFILQNIAQHKVSIICLNPTLLFMLAKGYVNFKCSLFSLKKIYVSGSILRDTLFFYAQDVFKEIPIYNVYGLSEASPRVSAQREPYFNNNSVGKPIKGVSVVLVNEMGVPVSKGEKGILHVKTPSLFCGYISGNRELKSLYRDWLNTGDIAYFDCHDDIHIIDRLDDVIVINSHKIYPSEIENKIIHYTGIEECVLTVVEYDGVDFLVCLYSGNQIIDDSMVGKLKKEFSLYEVPTFFFRCLSLPRTSSGKILKSKVKEYCNSCMKSIKREDFTI